jgi:hypothetical protein
MGGFVVRWEDPWGGPCPSTAYLTMSVLSVHPVQYHLNCNAILDTISPSWRSHSMNTDGNGLAANSCNNRLRVITPQSRAAQIDKCYHLMGPRGTSCQVSNADWSVVSTLAGTGKRASRSREEIADTLPYSAQQSHDKSHNMGMAPSLCG